MIDGEHAALNQALAAALAAAGHAYVAYEPWATACIQVNGQPATCPQGGETMTRTARRFCTDLTLTVDALHHLGLAVGWAGTRVWVARWSATSPYVHRIVQVEGAEGAPIARALVRAALTLLETGGDAS